MSGTRQVNMPKKKAPAGTKKKAPASKSPATKKGSGVRQIGPIPDASATTRVENRLKD
jgi:hypothetical protein